MKISFVIPVYDEKETLRSLVEAITRHAAPHAFRILFIDDGSTDGSAEVLRALHAEHDSVEVLRFRRNFGKSAALAAGFSRADGDVVFTMDADLQDDPKEIPRFLAKLEDGFDVVTGWKEVRNDPWHKTIPSRVYNGLVSRLFDLDIHDINCGFKAYRAEVVKALDVYGELHRLIPVLAADLGYRVAEIAVEHHPRRYGRSKYGFERFSRGAADVLATLLVRRHRYTPAHFFGRLGLILLAGSLGCAAGAALAFVVKSSLLLMLLWTASMALFAGGIVVVALGLLAELLLRQHPLENAAPYIVEELRR